MASLATTLQNFATRVGTEFKTLRGTLGTNSALSTSDKTTLVAAINEVNNRLGSAGAQIDDATPRTTTAYSSSKTNSVATAAANAAVAAVINGAPTAFDTLKEIADYIASDQSNATAFQTALDNRISVAATQTYTAAQVTAGLANLVALGAAKQSDLTTLTNNVGDTTVDLVTAFNNALV